MLRSVVWVRARTRRGKEWSTAAGHVLFLKSGWLGFSMKGAALHPAKGGFK